MLSQVRYRFRGRRSAFARRGADFAAGAALSQGQVRISWQAQYFRKVSQISQQAQHFCKVRDRFAADAGLSQGAVHISRQAQHFRKRCQFRSRRSTFARYGAEFDAGAALNQRGVGGGGKIHKMALVASKPNNQTAYNKISKIHRKQDKNHQATQKPEQPPTKYLIKA